MMTMLKGRRIGLAAKVNAPIVGSILATVLGTGALTLRNMTAESFQQLLSDGATLAASGTTYIDVLHPIETSRAPDEGMLFPENSPHRALGEVIGFVQIGLSEEGMRARLRTFLLHAAWSAAVCVLLFVAATILLM